MESLDDIWTFLDRVDLILDRSWSSGRGFFPVSFDLTSEDFMAFAKEDLTNTDVRSLVNALSNIKRAIDCRIFALLYYFGVYATAKKEKWNFPKCADFLSQIGVLAPNILKKINRKRNELEHDFKKPTYEDVVDYYDIASLFLESTNQFLNKTYLGYTLIPDELEVRNWLDMTIDYDKGVINLEYIDREQKRCISIPTDGEETHIKLLKHFVKHFLVRY